MTFSNRLMLQQQRQQHWLAAIALIGIFLLSVWSAFQLDNLRFDASSETLVAKNAPSVAAHNQVAANFKETSILVLTYQPFKGDLWTQSSMHKLSALTQELKKLEGVSNVTSILDVPLLKSPGIPLQSLARGEFNTVMSDESDLALAKEEIVHSPLFSESLISREGDTAAIIISLQPNSALEAARQEWRDDSDQWSEETKDTKQATLRRLKREAATAEGRSIESIRKVAGLFADHAHTNLGGIPAIRSDMVNLIQRDLKTIGLVVFVLFAAILWFFFRDLKWVGLSLTTTVCTLLMTNGTLVFFDFPITAVSASYIALISIISISFAIHLITRYHELRSLGSAHVTSIQQTLKSKIVPCAYTALTVMVAFGSLATSGILPLEQFGWIMCLGVVISLIVSTTLFHGFVWIGDAPAAKTTFTEPTTQIASFVIRHPKKVLLASLVVSAACVIGVKQIVIGNKVVEYFRPDTSIRTALDFIDRELGGTMPLDIVLRFEPFDHTLYSAEDEFDDFGASTEDAYLERFWFTPEKLDKVAELQSYLESLPSVGKSQSITNLEEVARTFNNNRPLSFFQLTAILDKVPEKLRSQLIAPFASPERGLIRIAFRLHESSFDYHIPTLVSSVLEHAATLGFKRDQIQISGPGILFNDMLEQLTRSQQQTISLVCLAIVTMLAIMLRSLALALIGIVPNLLASTAILSVMGFSGIKLDIMTVTIAAVVMGIGIHDSIHYLHRYCTETRLGSSTAQAILTSHQNTGLALYLTSLTVIVGFMALLFSSFMPTMYFGLLVSIAMVFSLVANLILLPALLLLFDSRCAATNLKFRKKLFATL